MNRFVFALGVWCCFSPLQAEPYLRSRALQDGGKTLDIAARAFSPAANTNLTVWLVGVSHVGTSNYYSQIQALLNDCDLVLFEGVDGDRPEFRERSPDHPQERGDLQVRLARTLGLEFQLHAIDYSKGHFRNSDLSAAELVAVFEGLDPETMDSAALNEFEDLLATMSNESFGGNVAAMLLDWVGAYPGLRTGMTYMMVEISGNLQGDLSQLGGVPQSLRELMDVLIRRRNEVVVRDVDLFLDSPGDARSVAVFYGAAHMEDLEFRLTEAHGLIPTAERWFPAMTANLNQSSLSAMERAMVKWFVSEQVRTLKQMLPPAKEPQEAPETDCDPLGKK